MDDSRGLTNVARHSGATTATVTLHQDARALHLEARDEGARGGPGRGGRLAGARRAAAGARPVKTTLPEEGVPTSW
ncbi:MAG: hypothetical protein HOY71_52760 [Nonomuraea sp.]|nr:hypothetical protein [Nonomuraea sp.]